MGYIFASFLIKLNILVAHLIFFCSNFSCISKKAIFIDSKARITNAGTMNHNNESITDRYRSMLVFHFLSVHYFHGSVLNAPKGHSLWKLFVFTKACVSAVQRP